jgi:DNA-binding NarL/FixJ family response regulator
METLQLVRILLVGMSNMLSSIITAALAQAHDFVVVGNIGEHEDLFSQIRQTSADAVIVQTHGPGAAEPFVPLLRSFPTLKVMAIESDCSVGFLHQLRPHSTRFPELSADVLQSVLRTGF